MGIFLKRLGTIEIRQHYYYISYSNGAQADKYDFPMSRVTQSGAEPLIREMGLSYKEFMRTLPAAITPLEYWVEKGVVTIDHPAGPIEIHLQPETERRLGAFRLPVIIMEFHFQGLDPTQRREFLDRFDLHFQRGGG